MHSLVRTVLLAPIVLMWHLPATLFAQNPPVISPFPDATVISHSEAAFDEFELPVGPSLNQKFVKTLHLEGKHTFTRYTNPEEHSTLEIARNYESALLKAGFQILFSCKKSQCGSGGYVSTQWMGYFEPSHSTYPDIQYLAAKLSRPEGDVYVAVHVAAADSASTYVNIIEVKPLETGLVTVNAEALSGDITRTGHVAIYGINFDTDRAVVKPESEPVLGEIAKLLQENPGLKLLVVGHTDNTGDFAHNIDLSKRRANAVMAALTTNYGVAAARMRADGVGQLAPVASNKTEEGRAKNRRVELVEQ